MADLRQIALDVWQHQQDGQAMPKITARYELSADEAYQVQALVMEEQLRRGDRLVGWKAGLTSAAKQKSMGVEEPIYGRLLASQELAVPELYLSGKVHPRVEPEIAFVLKKRLGGATVTPRDVWLATEYVVPAFEIIDSRYENFSFTLADVVADNASGCQFYTATQAYSPYFAPLDEIGVVVRKNGDVVQTGAAAAVLGHPVESIVTLVRMLDRVGAAIEPGMVVLTGGITEAVHLGAGDRIDLSFDRMGTIALAVRP